MRQSPFPHVGERGALLRHALPYFLLSFAGALRYKWATKVTHTPSPVFLKASAHMEGARWTFTPSSIR
jgi:hypothetical protein